MDLPGLPEGGEPGDLLGLDGGGPGGGRKPVGGLAVGDRREKPFLRLYERLPEAGLYRSDAYPVYQWFPQDKHKVGKGSEVNWSEGLHSVCRSKLNRLIRRTKGYTKSLEMLVYSLALVFWQRWVKSNTTAR